MKKKIFLLGILMTFSLFASASLAGEIALVFNPNDIFMYATEDGTRLEQQGTARHLENSTNSQELNPLLRYYMTYNDSDTGRDDGATPEEDLESISNILGWTASCPHQGVCHLQLWLKDGYNVTLWGEKVIADSFSGASVNGETDWNADVSTGYAHFNTVLGGPENQNAISLDVRPAENLWYVAGDFYDLDDSDLEVGKEYTIWFYATLNNWHYVDAYGNDNWDLALWNQAYIEGTIIAVALPEQIVPSINDCAKDAKNHGKFVSGVAHLANDLMKEGIITGEEKGSITSWAAGSNIP